ncbi:MAG: copper-translocating P-type ATPase [candidate division Zixibacteria bacterium]|nr:copper-translocating P-type ATPase [candidate division Zixibacteria bacterium]NIR67594.1 copper-translocating P-type ATPase [candidate division Zixibacteria bacterium]NIS16325.1 copper-translocating P-type ATPase [candidate division Zixibacteria bacterium]NIS48855.1 copper-translocating P-type ATPase [candidate division Zixibacteria bacterium]NIT52703.1 copper-translocating P-type ATPase [candidate division Zixibacteria bacterium]
MHDKDNSKGEHNHKNNYSQNEKEENKHQDHDNHNHDKDHNDHDHKRHHKHMAEDFKRRFWISLILTIPIVVLSPMIQGFVGLKDQLAFSGDSYVQFVFATAVFFYGGYPFLKGIVKELRELQPGMMTLIALAILVAYVYSSAVVFGLSGRTFFWELATLIDVMLLGHWIEMRSVMGASRALDELAKLMPSDAHKLQDDGSTEDVPVRELEKGDKVVIKPGEKVPVDGKIVEGSTSIDESLVTGESEPVSKGEGDEVVGGSVNGDGSITVEIEKTGKDSYLSQVMDMVESAQASKSKSQNLADKAAMWLTFIAIGAGTTTLILWLTAFGREFVFALGRMVTVMVITCPHALGLAIPLVIAVSTALSAKNGLLIRNRVPFESARNIDAIIFDKTGTLTKGTFEVSEILAIGDNTDKDEILMYAASVEARSEHPIAKAITEATQDKKKVESFEAIKGKGATGKVDGKDVKVVSPGYLDENDIDISDEAREFAEKGKTIAYVLIDNDVKGAIALEDPVREESKEAIKKLKEKNIKTLMITGDNEHVAKRVADEIGLEDFFAGVLPDKKAEKIKEVQSEGYTTAMVGDGVNDAPALAQADVGIAIGAGTDVAMETADIVLVKNNPMDVVKIIAYSRATYKKMVQNLIWATGYNAIAIPLAAGALYSFGILLNPAVGALLMSLSTVIVAINAKFLKVPEVE